MRTHSLCAYIHAHITYAHTYTHTDTKILIRGCDFKKNRRFFNTEFNLHCPATPYTENRLLRYKKIGSFWYKIVPKHRKVDCDIMLYYQNTIKIIVCWSIAVNFTKIKAFCTFIPTAQYIFSAYIWITSNFPINMVELGQEL